LQSSGRQGNSASFPKKLDRRLPAPGAPYDPRLADAAVPLLQLLFKPRFRELAFVLLRFLCLAILDVFFADRKLSCSEKRGKKAGRVRQLLVDLGPTFVKVGQFLSTRRDILPVELADQFALLQDQVAPFGFDLVRQTIISDLGQPPEELFEALEVEPIAAASLGQVHRVRLKEGGLAVVKVQRPDLAALLYGDLGYMRLIARILGFLRGYRQNIWRELADQFGRTIFEELNYIEEGRNADRMRHLTRMSPRIRVPRVKWRYTGRRVLTLEYLPGTKIDRLAELQSRGVDLRGLCNLLVSSYLEQFLFSGFYHADPHAGNLAVDDQGNLVIYDFGMMGRISSDEQEALAGCLSALLHDDAQALVRSLVSLGLVVDSGSREPLMRVLKPLLAYYRGGDLGSADLSLIESDLEKLIMESRLRLPASLAYLVRAGSSVEGLVRTLRPNFSFVAAARPVIKRWLIESKLAASPVDRLALSIL